jgi:hypothetical protein
MPVSGLDAVLKTLLRVTRFIDAAAKLLEKTRHALVATAGENA